MNDKTLLRVIECAEILDKRPRPMCRDCADENGICPNSGLDCDMRKLFSDARAALSHASPADIQPVGSIATLIGKLEHSYGFECEAGPLSMCRDWIDLKRSVLNTLTEVDGCFEAAYAEGLADALAGTPDDHLKDLVTRRLLWARRLITDALYAAPVAQSQHSEIAAQQADKCDNCGGIGGFTMDTWIATVSDPEAYSEKCEVCNGSGIEPSDATPLPLQEPKPVAPDVCEWTLIDDEQMIWQSGCGETWSFIDGGPKDNNMKYCHSCGKPLKDAAIDAAIAAKKEKP